MLIKDVTVAVLAAGLDPDVGVYYRPSFGRPALSLDLYEEFRPLVGGLDGHDRDQQTAR
jgi:CRISPR-associated protein Cas1